MTQTQISISGAANGEVDSGRHHRSISFLVPVLNEVESLTATVDQVFEHCDGAIGEILIIVGSKTTPESLAAAHKLEQRHEAIVRVIEQRKPFLGGALQSGMEAAAHEFVMMMSSDLETNPSELPRFIERQLQTNADIVVASRWKDGGGFASDYGTLKKLLNRVFQWSLRRIYGVPLTDFTYGFRLYRSRILHDCLWTELKHPFLLESLLVPLSQGAVVEEVPSRWAARSEGESSNSMMTMFSYWKTALRIRSRRIPGVSSATALVES